MVVVVVVDVTEKKERKITTWDIASILYAETLCEQMGRLGLRPSKRASDPVKAR